MRNWDQTLDVGNRGIAAIYRPLVQHRPWLFFYFMAVPGFLVSFWVTKETMRMGEWEVVKTLFFFTFLHKQDHEPFPRLSDACSHSVAGISEICCECESYPTRTNLGFACSLNCLDELGHSDHGNILSFVGTWLSNSKTVAPSSHHLWCLATNRHMFASFQGWRSFGHRRTR